MNRKGGHQFNNDLTVVTKYIESAAGYIQQGFEKHL
jgi:hypothetical protein